MNVNEKKLNLIRYIYAQYRIKKFGTVGFNFNFNLAASLARVELNCKTYEHPDWVATSVRLGHGLVTEKTADAWLAKFEKLKLNN